MSSKKLQAEPAPSRDAFAQSLSHYPRVGKADCYSIRICEELMYYPRSIGLCGMLVLTGYFAIFERQPVERTLTLPLSTKVPLIYIGQVKKQCPERLGTSLSLYICSKRETFGFADRTLAAHPCSGMRATVPFKRAPTLYYPMFRG